MSLTLLDWRRRVAALYRDVRATNDADPTGTLARFRAAKDELFAGHPETPLLPADRDGFDGLRYWPYDPALRFDVTVEPAPPTEAPGAHALQALSVTGDAFALERIGRIVLPVGSLDVYWISVYGGGVFVPFRDATNGTDTYGAGRYLLDTVKGADLRWRRWPPDRRLQLRLSPVLCVRPEVELSACPAGEPSGRGDPRRRAAHGSAMNHTSFTPCPLVSPAALSPMKA